MKNIFFGFLVLILVGTSLFTACKTTSTSSTTQSTTTATTATPTSTQSQTASTTQANWWDSLGKPIYGGELNLQTGNLPTSFDTYSFFGLCNIMYEQLIAHNWAFDRSEYNYKQGWTAEKYHQGLLAESLEWTDAQTLIVHLRQNVYWQDKSPTNGRKFTAEDIVAHYDRLLGTGHGFTTPSPTFAQYVSTFDKVTATDNYTVVIKFSAPSVVNNHWVMLEAPLQNIESPEWVALDSSGKSDWHNAAGTSPWILSDYVSGSSYTVTKNANYWGYDERYPQNKLPYLDEVTVIAIPDSSTAQAALRTKKVDMLSGLSWQIAENLIKTNPELEYTTLSASGSDIHLRVDHEPFTNIKVRIALQMSLDLPTIAKSYFNGTVDGIPVGMVSPAYAGYAIPFDQWSQATQDEYTYNPEGAKKLLSEAGHPDGFKTSIVASSTSDLQLLQVVKSYFGEINVDMEIVTMEGAAYQDYTRAFKHDQMLWGSSTAGLPPYISITNWMARSNEQTRHGDTNYDAIVDKFLTATTEDEAQQILSEADMYFIQHHWTVELFPIVNYTFWQPYLQGYLGESAGMAFGGFYYARLWVDGK